MAKTPFKLSKLQYIAVYAEDVKYSIMQYISVLK